MENSPDGAGLDELDHLRFMLEASPQVPWTADQDGNITWISRRWEEVMGAPVEAALGQGFRAFLHPDDLEKADAAGRRSLETKCPYDVEYRVRHANDNYRWTRARAIPRFDRNGEIVAWYGSSEDVHDRKVAQDEAAAALESLRVTQETLSLAMKGGRMGWWAREAATDRVTWSPELEEIFGLEPGSFGGTRNRFLELVHPDDVDRFKEAVANAWAAKGDYVVEFRFTRPDGSEGWMEGRGRAIFDENGEVTNSHGFGIDISRQKQAQESANAQLRVTRTITESADSPLMMLDIEGFTTYANPAFFRVTRYLAEDLPGKTAAELLQFRPGGDNPFREAIRNLETSFRRKDGTSFPVLAHVATLYDASGQSQGSVLEFRDITELRRAQEEAREAAAILEQKVAERTFDLQTSNETLRGFTYHVSHDLRTPLRGIASTSRIVLEDYGELLPDEAKMLLDRQTRAANKLGQLIDDLLRLSRLNQQEIVKERLDFTQMVHDAVRDALSSHPETQVQIVVEEGLSAIADARLLKLAMTNLIENAIKYSPFGGQIRVGKLPGNVFFVEDQGIGIDARYFEKIFLPFERLHNDEEFEGTGIGLSNVSQVIVRHGGRIWVESVLGEGSNFRFTLEG